MNWWNDIRSLAVNQNASTVQVGVRHLAKPSVRTGGVRTYLDTNADGQPDFEFSVGQAGGGESLGRMTGWGRLGPHVTCPSLGSTVPGTGTNLTTFTVDLTCLGNPASVRVAVWSVDFGDSSRSTPTDRWGGTRRWSPSIAQG